MPPRLLLAVLLAAIKTTAYAQSGPVPSLEDTKKQCRVLFTDELVERHFDRLIVDAGAVPPDHGISWGCRWLLGLPAAPAGTANLAVTVSVIEEKTAEKARDDFYAVSGIRPPPRPTPVPGMADTEYHWPFDDRRRLQIDSLRGSRIVIFDFELPRTVGGWLTNATLRQAFTFARAVVDRL